MLNEFISYLEEQIGQPYVWGAQHLRLRPSDYVSIITRKEENARHEKNAIEFCRKKFANGAKEMHAFDCSGLGMYWLQNKQKLYKYDMNANSMMAKCTIVETKPKKGYWVFRVSGTRATHIGYMVDDTHVVHSKGREYGVVKEQYSSYYWHAVGIPKVFAEEIIGKPANDIFVFKRVLKYGSTGEDVKELKKLLLAKGYGGLTISNGNFYSATSKVVKQFQKDKGLVVDGIAGKKTITALGGVWEG